VLVFLQNVTPSTVTPWGLFVALVGCARLASSSPRNRSIRPLSAPYVDSTASMFWLLPEACNNHSEIASLCLSSPCDHCHDAELHQNWPSLHSLV